MAKVFIKDTNGKDYVRFNSGDKFFQGIASHYGIAVGDSTSAKRNGGFGSTGK